MTEGVARCWVLLAAMRRRCIKMESSSAETKRETKPETGVRARRWETKLETKLIIQQRRRLEVIRRPRAPGGAALFMCWPGNRGGERLKGGQQRDAASRIELGEEMNELMGLPRLGSPQTCVQD